MRRVNLVCLTVGKKKNGGGDWYKVTLRAHNSEGKPIVSDFFINQEVGEKMVSENLVEDVDVNVQLGFDDYFRPCITSITKATTTATSSKSVG